MNPTGAAPQPITFQDWQLVLLSPWGTAGIALAILAVLVALFLSTWSARHQPRRDVLAKLFLLRLFALAAVLLLVLQPAIQVRSVTQVPNYVVVLLDLSRSMGVRETAERPTRLQQALALLRASAGRVASWQRERRVDFVGFGDGIKPLAQPLDELHARDPATRMWTALSKLRQTYSNRDLAAVILVSDGIDNGRLRNLPLSAAARRSLAGLEVPVHTLWVGSSSLRDVAVAEVFSDDFAFVHNAVQVEADIIAHGVEAERITVALEKDGQAVAHREVRLQPGRSRYRVRFEFVPERVGKYVYTITTPLHPGEALASNNQRSFIVKVIRDRIRVLQVCGRPSWDERFLRDLLKRDPNIDLISFFILRTPNDLSLVPTAELSLIPFPTEELFEKELGSFDLVLLQDFNYRPYGMGTYLPFLRRFVEQGGGLAMLGGSLSFSSGGYQGTPVAEVLPVELLPEGGQPERLVSEDDFRLQVTREGAEHPILQVGPTRHETEQLLAAVPTFAGVNLVAGAAPGATVLATHPLLKDQRGQPMPVLVTREVGKGRTLALTTDSSWHWAFHSVGAGGTRGAYDRFWRNAIRWLIQDPELRYLRVIVQRDAVPLGAPVRAIVRAFQPDYSPAQQIKVSYSVDELPGGKGLLREGRTGRDGEFAVEFIPPKEGAFRIHATAEIGGRATEEEALVLVEPASSEEREARAYPDVLQQIAEATGGRYLGQARSLPNLALRQPRMVRVNWRRDVELWSGGWSLVICVFLLGLEWATRRRHGHL